MKDINQLPENIQIEKLNKENKVLLIFAICFSILLIALSVYLIILEEPRELGFGFLICLPISILFGAVLPIKENKEKIKRLESALKKEQISKDTKIEKSNKGLLIFVICYAIVVFVLGVCL
jgi:5-bromo-4-chloroindolyl phosphate hydrolysis protein